jgi:hypothetical protein
VGAGGVLVGGLYVGHVFEQNTTRQCSNFFTGLIRLEAVGITAVETVTGIVWRILALSPVPFLRAIAAGVLFVGLNVEHTVAAGLRRRCY